MADLSHSFGFASEEAKAKRAEVDLWEHRIRWRTREYLSQGMTLEQAEEEATKDIRREIRRS